MSQSDQQGGPQADADAPRVRAQQRRARSTADRKQTPPRPLLGWLGVVGLRAAALLPWRAVHVLGGVVGWLGSFLPIRERLATRVNLELCFPELSPRERRRLARTSFAEAGRFMVELGALWCWERERVLGLVREVHGEEHLREALAVGKGAIMVMPHLGSWELTGLYCSARYKITGLYRPPRVREMEAIYTNSRKRFGAHLVPAGASGVRAIYTALRRGELTAMLPDQDPGRGAGLFVPFFGHLANTSSLLSRLAQRSGAPVVFAYSKRRARGDGFDVYFLPGSPEIHEGDLEASVAAVNRDVERCVRALPEQYLWSYKRFRYQPDRKPSPYKVAAR